MAKITVYQPLDTKENGKWYRVWEVEEGTPLGNVVYEAPSADLQFPKYDATLGKWVEDRDSIIESFKTQFDDLQVLISSIYEGGVE